MLNSEKTNSLRLKVQEGSERGLDRAETSHRGHLVPETHRAPEVTHNVDILKEFAANLNLLEDLHHRLQFVMKDVSTVISKRFK